MIPNRRTTTLAAALAAVAFLAGASGAAQAESITAKYSCYNGTRFTATFTPPGATDGSVRLAFADGHKITLPQVISADGGRYASGETEFWIKGLGGQLTTGRTMTNCDSE